MEATSARYASRSRFDYPMEPAATPLLRYIQNACSPDKYEPDLGLCLEIADLVNAKQAGAPREAAINVVAYINHRNPNVSLLALSLLDILVKNCGYPFHLQISTKEFLNELVRRFPERPPIRTTRVQNRILELIEEWRRTICETSKYKEDLGYIRDMHRLLTYKGYQFPAIKREDAAVLNPSDNLKSAEEMEAEERAAQSAKLQELIRRGSPHDLQEANKLMKVMAGYDTRKKVDYRATAAAEVGKVQQKAKLLEEMLEGHKQGEKINEGDVFEELANALASAHPKIQKMCEEESDDHEAVAKLFEINDSIQRTLDRYKLTKKGDYAAANAIPKGTLGVSGAGVRTGPDNELSLIDFGGPDDQPTTSAPAQPTQGKPKAGNALEDDLLGLNMGDGNYGQGGGISLGSNTASNADIMAQFNQPTASNSIFAQVSKSPQPQFQQNTQSTSDLFGSFSAAGPQSKPSTPGPSSNQTPAKSDPFAVLSGSSRQQSPFPAPQSSVTKATAQPSGSVDLLGGALDGGDAQAADDEWTFSSALPDEPKDLVVIDSVIKALFNATRTSDNAITIRSSISNNTNHNITDLTLQLAVTKSYTLHLQPQSSRNLGPQQKNGITQVIRLDGAGRGSGTTVKMRWRASYTVQGENKNEQGEIIGLGVS